MSTLPGGRYAEWAVRPWPRRSSPAPWHCAPASTRARLPSSACSASWDRRVRCRRCATRSPAAVCWTWRLRSGSARRPPTAQRPSRSRWDVGGPARDIPTSVHFWADDGPGGSGVASTQWSVDGGPWTTGYAAPVPAPRHKLVVHTIEYRLSRRQRRQRGGGEVLPGHHRLHGRRNDALAAAAAVARVGRCGPRVLVRRLHRAPYARRVVRPHPGPLRCGVRHHRPRERAETLPDARSCPSWTEARP